MPNQFGATKRHIKRAELLCEHIVQHLSPVHDQYIDDHPEFGEHAFTAARFATELQLYLKKLYDEFVSL